MRPALGVIAFLLLFAFLSFVYVAADDIREQRRFVTHANILADDVWALNQASARNYLLLAMKRDHYKSLQITETGGHPFLKLENVPLHGLDRFLESLHLISKKTMSTTVYHRGRPIAELSGEQYVRVVYPLINRFVFLLALLLAVLFVSRLFMNRRLLEQEVRDRTINLIESERRFHDLVNLLPEMVWETDLEGNVTYANQIAQLRLGMSSGGDIQTNWMLVIKKEQRGQASDYFDEVVRGDAHGLREFNAIDTAGELFPVLIRSAPIMQGDNATGARSVAIDITERHSLEEQLRRAQQMKAVGLMAGGVAHDLNNILSGVVTYPELLLLDLEETSPLREGLESIRRSGIAASEVVSDLLTVARGAAARRETVLLNELVEEYIASAEARQLMALHPAVSLSVDLSEGSGAISCSPVHVKKCIMNLVTNGVEAIPEAGTVIISTSSKRLSVQQANKYSLGEGEYAVLRVADDGPGVDEKDLNHIFEPFYTKKVMGRSGTGLGLAVVWNTVREHEGGVFVTSRPGETIFEIFLPQVESLHGWQSADEFDWQNFTGAGEHVLVVDDEPQQREMAKKILRSLRYSVTTVESGEDAVAFFRKEQADLLVLDMLMEPGQNGRETYEQILKIQPEQKAIIVSGYSGSDEVKKALELGAGSFVAKPYTLAQLGESVYRALHDMH